MAIYRVFTQSERGSFDPVKLVQHARRFFSSELELLDARGSAPEFSSLRLRLTSPERAALDVQVTRRRTEPADLTAAERAEHNGRSAGMSLLAARCAHVWDVDVPGSDLETTRGALLLCGVLASVGLGPALPPDESGLFGVRGALERADKLRVSGK